MSLPLATRASGADISTVSDLNCTALRGWPPAKSASPIRILHVIDRLHLGGTEKVIAKLIKELDPDLFQHSICTLRGTDPAVLSWLPDIEITDAGCEAPGYQFSVLRLAKIMRAIRPTIVHSRNWGGIEAPVAARSAGVPAIVHSEHGYQLDMKDGLPLRQRVMRHVAYRCAHAVFTVTDELRDFHAAQAWWNPKSMGVLHNGVDGRRFSPSVDVSRRVRLQLGIPRDALVVGFVGRLIALKDVKTLLLALENVVPDVPEVHAMIVGSGPELVRLQNYVAGSERLRDRVCFAGSREDVADLLKAMDIFVLPSLMEGMSNTILEAMATGLPIVATAVGGNPEILTDSRCGYLFQPGDAASLSEKLSSLLRSKEKRDRFGRESRERVMNVFSLQAMVTRYRELYRQLATREGAVKRTGNYVRN